MRIAVLCFAALLLSGCTWLRHQIEPVSPPAAVPAAKPEPVKPHKPRVERPAAALPSVAPSTPAPPDYGARCHAMADNRAGDAKQLGASTADQAKIQSDTYRDCMAQSVK